MAKRFGAYLDPYIGGIARKGRFFVGNSVMMAPQVLLNVIECGLCLIVLHNAKGLLYVSHKRHFQTSVFVVNTALPSRLYQFIH